MAKNHAIFNGTHCAFWDVDAYNLVGIAATDIDNATFLTLGDIKLKTDGGYEFAVTADAANAGEYVAGTPAVGYGIEAQIFDDPRYFYNETGKPISVKKLVKGDCIEVDLAAFTVDPTTSAYAKVAAGKLTGSATNSDPFKILGTHTIDIGGELVKTWILMKQ